jgi:hypothetical protein
LTYQLANDQGPTIPRYIEWEADSRLVTVPKLLLRAAGWKRVQTPVHRLEAVSYLDRETGEVIKKREMYRRRLPVPNNLGLRLIEQQAAVNSLGARARNLCTFLLRMRNARGGFVRPLSDLVDDYIHRDGTVDRPARARIAHAKLVGEIAATGIIANLQTLGSDFQKHGDRSPHKVLEEAALWYAWPGIFRGKSGFHAGGSDRSSINTSKTPETPAV